VEDVFFRVRIWIKNFFNVSGQDPHFHKIYTSFKIFLVSFLNYLGTTDDSKKEKFKCEKDPYLRMFFSDFSANLQSFDTGGPALF
jgi:hypothetical protein